MFCNSSMCAVNSELKAHTDLNQAGIHRAGGKAEIRRRHDTGGWIHIGAVQRVGDVCKHVRVLASPAVSSRSLEEERLGDIEIESDDAARRSGISSYSRGAVAQGAVLVVVASGGDVVPLAGIRRHGSGEEQTKRQLSVHGRAQVVGRESAVETPIGSKIVAVGRSGAGGRRIWPARGTHSLQQVIRRSGENAEPLTVRQPKQVMQSSSRTFQTDDVALCGIRPYARAGCLIPRA